MRPVDKGPAQRAYVQYRDAAPDLVERIADYCSYCERQIETHLAIEHIQPKSLNDALRNSWSNFLLGCVNCNSCKGDTAINLNDYFWPDVDNTILVFDYQADGRVLVEQALNAGGQQVAQATIELVGLDREPGHPQPNKRPTSADLRWRRRQEAWELARHCETLLERNNSPEVRELIVQTALGRGMFSIWMKVFEHDVDLRQSLIAAFRGTAPNCFDAVTTQAVARPGGRP